MSDMPENEQHNEILPELAIAEIERDLAEWDHPLESGVAELFYKHCGALCHTVRALRDELGVADDALENQSQWLSELRAQLAQAEVARDQLSDALSVRDAQLAQLTEERDRLREQAETERKAGNWGR
jgi:chromosome segregation ATPase